MKTKQISVTPDEITTELSRMFDYEFSGISKFDIPQISTFDRQMYIDQPYNIGLIVGPSGSGKSSLLKEFGSTSNPFWSKIKSVASHFDSADDAVEKFGAVGFNTTPSWMRPYHVLSNGEAFRADLSRKIKDGAVIDEFTSVVDRNVAKSCSLAFSKYVKKHNVQRITLASCHYDIIDWLQPDWVYDTVAQEVLPRGSLQRPKIEVEVVPCSIKAWEMFRHHHYLSGDINKSSRCYLAIWNDVPVGFNAVIAFPTGSIKGSCYRGHRTVILPDFQGMGIGVRFSDAIGEIMLAEGHRYFSKTAHPRLGEYRNASPKWRPTAHNMQDRSDYNRLVEGGNLPNPRKGAKEGELKWDKKYSYELMMKHRDRICYAHEYIG